VLTASSIVYIILSVAVGYFAKERGRSPWGWGLASFFTTPLLCFILLLIVGRRK